MPKAKSVYTCQSCTAQFPKWMGQCLDCGAWNTLQEEVLQTATAQARTIGFAGERAHAVTRFSSLETKPIHRILSPSQEFNRVLGGGVVPGSVTLLGGDPGIGKSTLLLQLAGQLSHEQAVLYVSGEESLQQMGLRAERLGQHDSPLDVFVETSVEAIIATAQTVKPRILIIDSIQTLASEQLSAMPGSVSQVRECASQLVRLAKQHEMALFLIGHVTKEGNLAGPRVLEHMVDTVLYFEGQSDSRYRLVRAFKNRFGAVNELAMFAMTDKGLKEVSNPSAIFLSARKVAVAGSVITAAWEGTRPFLLELQALVDQSHGTSPRRVTLGMDANRLAMLLAVLHRHTGIASFDQDVFINVVGGVRLSETAGDLAMVLTIISSLKDQALPIDVMAFGEIGLAGELRPVPYGQERVKEAIKQGIKTIILPEQNAPRQAPKGIQIHALTQLQQVLPIVTELT